METSKPTSTISDLVSKFAQVCRFTSTEVHIPQHQHELDEINDAAAAAPPVNLFLPEGTKVYDDMLKLFELVSDFKAAYVLLQQAHIPYNPLKIQAADHLAVQALSKIKRRRAKVVPEIQIKEKRVLESLKLEAKTKRHRIQSLRRELLQLDLENADLIERLNKKTTSQIQIPRCILDFDAFKDIVTCASTSVHDFAKPLISLMKASGWDLDLAANSVQHSVIYHKRCHKKYAFEAYIFRRMFSQQFTAIHQDQDQESIITAALRSDDPMEYLINQPHSAFSNFCRSKYRLVIHRDLELSFFGNLDHRTLVSNQKHPRTSFYQAFAKMARWFWILRGVSSTISPKAVVYEVKRGTAFSDKFMELVEQDIKGVAKSSSRRHSDYKVAFMIMPGFRVGQNLIKSRIYCCKERSY
ncbi:hypothetical protein QQ045_005060 [Rhodiola kirilowii]